MSIAFGRVSSQQFWEAIREQLQVNNAAMTVIWARTQSDTQVTMCSEVQHVSECHPALLPIFIAALLPQAPMARAGADAELQQFAKTFDDVNFRKGEKCCSLRCIVISGLPAAACRAASVCSRALKMSSGCTFCAGLPLSFCISNDTLTSKASCALPYCLAPMLRVVSCSDL
jgi:membrane protease subunit (stomatin/prohibitin family)